MLLASEVSSIPVVYCQCHWLSSELDGEMLLTKTPLILSHRKWRHQVATDLKASPRLLSSHSAGRRDVQNQREKAVIRLTWLGIPRATKVWPGKTWPLVINDRKHERKQPLLFLRPSPQEQTHTWHHYRELKLVAWQSEGSGENHS